MITQKVFTLFAVLCVISSNALAAADIHLAIVPTDESLRTPADLLTAALSKEPGITVLERAEIDRVWREQATAAAAGNPLKLGQLLGADGVWLLEPSHSGTNRSLAMRLVAVKPGVVLTSREHPFPLTAPSDWMSLALKQFQPFFPKLAVLTKDAIPISVVNLRSSGPSANAEQELKLLTIQRLSRDPRLFVLERQKMHTLAQEKDWKLDDSAFWNGSYLLEGVVDQNGYSTETITINARLTPPKGGAPVLIEVSGSRTNLPAVINQLAVKLNEALKVGSAVKEWNSADEAAQYFAEAKWAMKWELWEEAQVASEAAWALGNKTREVADVRIRSYHEAARPSWPAFARAAPTQQNSAPNRSKLPVAIQALQLYEQGCKMFLAGESAPDLAWYGLGLQLLSADSDLLEQFCYYAPNASSDEKEHLAQLRTLARETVAFFSQHPAYRSLQSGKDPIYLHTARVRGESADWSDRIDLEALKAARGAFWYETPRDYLQVCHEFVRSGVIHRVRKYLPYHDFTAWNPEQLKEGASLWQGFIQELCSSTNALIRVDGYYLAFADAQPDTYLNKAKHLFQVALENVLVLRPAGVQALENDLRDLLPNPPRGFPGSDINLETYTLLKVWKDECSKAIESNQRAERMRAARAYLESRNRFEAGAFHKALLFEATSAAEARELLPLLENYRQHLLSHKDDQPSPYEGKWPSVNNEITRLQDYLKDIVNRENTRHPRSSTPAQSPIPTAVQVDRTELLQVTRFSLLPPGLFEHHLRLRPDISLGSTCFREGRFWFQVFNGDKNLQLRKAFIFGVKLRNSELEVIPLPLPTGEDFAVWHGAVYVPTPNGLKRYSLKTKSWEDLAAPLESGAGLWQFNDRLFATTGDSILELNEDGKSMQVLASTRRRPAVTLLDSLEKYATYKTFPSIGGPPIVPGPGDSLRAFIKGRIYNRNKGESDWVQAASLPETRNYMDFGCSDEGMVIRHVSSTYETRWFLLRNTRSSPELALHAPRPRTPLTPGFKHTDDNPPPLWNYPQDVREPVPSPVWDGSSIWCFAGDLAMKETGTGGVLFKEEPAGYHALLLEFKNGVAEPRRIPLWFTLPDAALFQSFFHEFAQGFNMPNKSGGTELTRICKNIIFQITPEGVVITGTEVPGFWFIPREELQRKPSSDLGTALFAAVEAGKLNLAKELLARGAAVNARDHRGWTPLILAVKAGQVELVKLLLENGADVNAKSSTQIGSTVLCFAAAGGNMEILKNLLEHGADLNARSTDGTIPLFHAITTGQEKAVELLLAKGASLDEPGRINNKERNFTPVMAAAITGNTNVLELLLAKGASLEKRNNLGQTALMEAAKSPFPDSMRLLLSKGASVNAADPDGYTALLLAAYNDRIENVKMLLDHGANPYACAKSAEKPESEPLDAAKIARLGGHVEVLNLILQAQKRVGK